MKSLNFGMLLIQSFALDFISLEFELITFLLVLKFQLSSNLTQEFLQSFQFPSSWPVRIELVMAKITRLGLKWEFGHQQCFLEGQNFEKLALF